MNMLAKKRKKGFTLIELIVVIAILGILALLVIPRFIGVLNSARSTADDAQERVIQSAVQVYNAEEGEYPTNIGQLSPNYLEPNPVWHNDTPIAADIDDETGAVTFTNRPAATGGTGS